MLLKVLAAIEDPLHLGKTLSLSFAIFAEVLCPVLMIVGIATRFAALPLLVITLIALTLVHPEWTLDQAQFAWMLLILFGTIAIGGPGRYRVVLFSRTPASAARMRRFRNGSGLQRGARSTRPSRANPPDIVAGVPVPLDQSKFCFVCGFELP